MDLPDRIRAFVALPIPAAVRAALCDARRPLERGSDGERVRWVAEANLHLTLQFLGELPAERVPDLADALAAVAAGRTAIACRCERITAFPTARRARVIAAEIEASDALPALARAVGEALTPLGFPTEARPFRPHVTLGRVRRPPLRTPIDRPIEACRFQADEIALFRSELLPRGSRYTRLAHAALD